MDDCENGPPYISDTARKILYHMVTQCLEKKEPNLQTLYSLFHSVEAGKVVTEINDFVKWLYHG